VQQLARFIDQGADRSFCLPRDSVEHAE
jgi:hypothetical protein